MQSEEIGGRLAGDRRQNQWQSEATSPARRQSEEAIRGHQRPSEATSPACRHRACTRRRVRHISAGADRQSSSPRHQLPSGAISSRGNQTQSDAIRRNQRQSNALERTRARPSDAIRGHSGPIRRNRRSLRGHPEASPRPLPTKRHVRCCWLGNPIAIGCNQVQSGAITHEAARALLLARQSDRNLRRVERIRLERLGRRDHVRRGQPLEMVHASGGRGALHRPDEGGNQTP